MEGLLQLLGKVIRRDELFFLHLVQITFADVQALCEFLKRHAHALPALAYSLPVILDENDLLLLLIRRYCLFLSICKRTVPDFAYNNTPLRAICTGNEARALNFNEVSPRYLAPANLAVHTLKR